MNVKIVFSILSFLLLSFEVNALTPQKYCESLAATSCEVLNIEIAGCGNIGGSSYVCATMIKYCRNRQFIVQPTYKSLGGSNGQVYYRDASNSSQNFGNGSTSTTASNANLCANLP